LFWSPARSIDALQDLADSLGAQYGVRCVVLQADLAASDAAKRIVTELERLDLKIDLLINNAGLGLTGDFLSHDLAEELASIQVNVQALVGLSHALGAKMVSRYRRHHQSGIQFCTRRSNNPSVKRPDIPVAPEQKSGSR
jgi:uncharacterized protein